MRRGLVLLCLARHLKLDTHVLVACAIACTLALSMTGCADDQTPVAPGPVKQDGTRSSEFEQDDIDRADNASDAVKEYCSGAVSEAQRLGCESHVDESDIP